MFAFRFKRPTPAFVIAMLALFVALGGTAGAVATATVPLAKRALVAENAKKLGGQTSAQLVAQAARVPGPAASASGLVTIKTQGGGSVPADNSLPAFSATCDAGAKVIGGGMSSDGAIGLFDSYPKGDAAWEVVVGNFGSSPATVSVYAICLR